MSIVSGLVNDGRNVYQVPMPDLGSSSSGAGGMGATTKLDESAVVGLNAAVAIDLPTVAELRTILTTERQPGLADYQRKVELAIRNKSIPDDSLVELSLGVLDLNINRLTNEQPAASAVESIGQSLLTAMIGRYCQDDHTLNSTISAGLQSYFSSLEQAKNYFPSDNAAFSGAGSSNLSNLILTTSALGDVTLLHAMASHLVWAKEQDLPIAVKALDLTIRESTGLIPQTLPGSDSDAINAALEVIQAHAVNAT